jgi:hypothetical protein
MLGQAQSPLVNGDRAATRRSYRWLASLGLGLMLGSAAVVAIARLLASILATDGADRTQRLVVLDLALVVFLTFDVSAARRGGTSRLGISRQTPQRLALDINRVEFTAFLWGVDIGTGISTFRVTSAIWLGLLAVFLGLAPFYVGLLYGVGITAVIAVLILRKGTGTVAARLPKLLGVLRRLQVAYVVAAVVLGISAGFTIIGS